MSQVLPTVVAIAALLAGVTFAVMAEVFVMASGANSTPAQIQTLKTIMWSIAIGTLVCTVVSIVLMTKHHPWIAAGVGVAPAILFLGTLFVILVIDSVK